MSNVFSAIKYAPIAMLLIAVGIQAKTINKEYDVAKGGQLKIETDVGAIEIESHTKNTVLVEVDISGNDEDKLVINFAQNSDNLNITGKMDREGANFFNHNNIRVTYTIKVPQHYNLDIHTKGGSIDISRLTGRVDANTSGGSISLSQVTGDVDINTSGGSIKVDEVFGKIIAHTSGGSVKAKLSKTPTGNSQFSTSGGSINAYLAKDIAVDIYAKTSGGRVHSELNIEGSIKKEAIKGTLNGGGPELTFKTSGGSININTL